MKDKWSISIVGVGGQGILLVSDIIGRAALLAGKDVLGSEVHGMAQRGGVVSSTVRFGKIHSPLFRKGDIDILLGFEPVETLRAAECANANTVVVTSCVPIYPTTLRTMKQTYPDVNVVLDELKKRFKKLTVIDSAKICEEIGARIVENIVLLGALSAVAELPISEKQFKDAISERVPKQFLDLNLKAFEAGRKAAENAKKVCSAK
ncbi:MAG: indolepyruvate oxidoreductase subunit beta [Thermoplasmata archaeon]